MKELFLIWHGQPEHHIKGLTGGWTDTPLTELGRKQAELTGPRLKEMTTSSSLVLYSSDLIRATETAQIIGELLDIVPKNEKALRDLNWGSVTDMPLEEALKLELEKTEPLIDWIPFHGAESWRMLHERVTPFLEKINRSESDTVLIVSHANTIEECIFWWLELPVELRRGIAFEIAPCSITQLCVNDWMQKAVIKLNSVDHLHSLET